MSRNFNMRLVRGDLKAISNDPLLERYVPPVWRIHVNRYCNRTVRHMWLVVGGLHTTSSAIFH